VECKGQTFSGKLLRVKGYALQTFNLLELPGKKFVLFWVVGDLDFLRFDAVSNL
jgi:hypothetical protein